MKRAILSILLVSCIQAGLAQDFLAKAKVALGTKDTSTALTALNLAVKNGQKAAEAHYYLGLIAIHRGQVQKGISELEESVKIDDESIDACRTLGEAYVSMGNYQQALKHLRRAEKLAVKIPSAQPAINAAYGKALLGVDSVDKAIAELSKAKEAMPNDPTIYEALGEAYGKQNVVPLVVMNYQKAIELDPTSVQRRMKLARVYEKDRKYSDAVKQFDEIIALDSTNADAYFQKASIYVRAGSTAKTRGEAAKYFREALPALKTYTRLRPGSLEGSVLNTKALYGSGDYAGVIPEAKRSLKLDSTNTDVWHMLEKAQVETGAYADAIVSFDALKRRKGFEPEDQADFGLAMEKLGRYDEALTSLLEAVRMDTTNCDAYNSIGIIYMRKKDWMNAGVMFEKRIACDPRALGAYLNGAMSFMQVKEWPRARVLLTQLVSAKPDYIQGHLWLARYYTFVDSLEMAKNEYDDVLRLISQSPEKFKKEAGETHFMLGQYYFRRQAYGSTIESMRRASSLGYDDGSLHLAWGQALLQTLDRTRPQEENAKTIDDAISHFRRGVALDPNNDATHLWLGQGLILSRVEGNDAVNRKILDEACGEFKKVLRLNPGNSDAKKSMERVGCK
jgi:tetratricopeptide (TPR) repeat protein